MEVLVQVANGMFNKEIAISLNVPEKNSIKEIHGFVEVPEVLGRFIEINNENEYLNPYNRRYFFHSSSSYH